MKNAAWLLIVLLMISISGNGFAQEKESAAPHIEPYVSPYSLDLTRDLILFGTAGALLTTGLILNNNLDPLTDEEIYALNPEDVNKFDRPAIGVRRASPSGDTLRNVSLLMPLTFLAFNDTRRDFGMLAVMSTEVILMNQGLTWMAKSLTRRTRPYVYEPDSPYEDKIQTKARRSFFSGHTSTTASMAFFTATVFSDYLSNKATKALIWTVAALTPALVGYLRVDSSNHFYTDVIAGYFIGALIGYGIPLLHRNKSNSLSLSPVISSGHFHFTIRYSF